MKDNSVDTMLNIVFDDIRVLKHKTLEIETTINTVKHEIMKLREHLTLEFENLKKEHETIHTFEQETETVLKPSEHLIKPKLNNTPDIIRPTEPVKIPSLRIFTLFRCHKKIIYLNFYLL